MATKQINITEASVYVGTYAKYNDGSIFGNWLKLSDYADREEFYNACAELHSDEEDPEYMFQDYEHIPKGLIGESWISENVFEVLEAIGNLSDNNQEAFLIWCNNGHAVLSEGDITDLISDFECAYIAHYDSDEDFARELIGERADLNDFAKQYFDYDAYANDLFCGDYWSEDGHVFYN
ncbi:antirestriction protein ArdA [Sphingobacterium sp. DR205]|uniref:antirestriction protein ArdA n=1 Tax=Sphingobacterium sp. DR205 TaxID=2713573 RepID=UPI0013E5000D|nr:antirestriction protein ArdA [Sphingobacterium sp. DR205]QIH34533.1 antirestriction protein ArdA [Sphingobacterium sp. DR205]